MQINSISAFNGYSTAVGRKINFKGADGSQGNKHAQNVQTPHDFWSTLSPDEKKYADYMSDKGRNDYYIRQRIKHERELDILAKFVPFVLAFVLFICAKSCTDAEQNEDIPTECTTAAIENSAK